MRLVVSSSGRSSFCPRGPTAWPQTAAPARPLAPGALAKVPVMVQYSSGTNASISRSRSQMRRTRHRLDPAGAQARAFTLRHNSGLSL